ncbi:MAG TPA: acyclic terpene utilization AtuA family protein [Actinomycetes bacterium]
MREPVRIANCSGFFGDRLAAAREQVEGGPIDVLTGDWLAELTMLILARQRLKHGPGTGYARTFVTQLEDVFGSCLERGIKVVSNAGGLDPAGCATAVREVAERLGLTATVVAVEGDDLLGRLDGLDLVNLATGERFADVGLPALTANAYLGGFGIKAALDAGADVVVTGRVTDAALVVGPAAWWHGWTPEDLDPLAGAVVAGHVIECGAQATGGNYAFFAEVPGLEHVGFPIAEVAADGSAVITKHEGIGGLVSVGTVTAQLLYEVDAPAYPNPDVTARFDTIELEQVGPDRVRVSGVVGEPPPQTLKVALNYLGGFRNTITMMLTGLDIDAKAELLLRQLWAAVPGGRESFESVDVQLLRHSPSTCQGEDEPYVVHTLTSQYEAQAELRVTVKDRDPKKVGKAFTAPAVELALASVPGLYPTAPPAEPTPYGVYWPTTVPRALVSPHEVPAATSRSAPWVPAAPPPLPAGLAEAPTTPAPLGRVFGARSGDKGGDANVGVWARTDDGYAWLAGFLTAERVHALLPETRPHHVDVHLLPNLRAVNVVVRGLLGRGVAENASLDPQAKALGEYLRAQVVELPVPLLPAATTDDGA